MIFTFIFAFSAQSAWPASSDLENEQVTEVATMSSASATTNFHISCARVHNVVHIVFLTYISNTQTKNFSGLRGDIKYDFADFV